MNILDLYLTLRADGALLQKDATKEGEKAGEAFGASFSGKVNASFASLAGFGAAAKLGSQGLIALEHGIADIIDIIPNMIHQGEDFALLVDDIADKTGASAVTASRFAGSLQYLGISTAGLGLSLKSLSGDIVNSEDKLNKLGIATRDSSGNLLDTITVLNNVRSYLSGAADGAAKLTLASDLLGKGAGTLVDYLNLTDEQAAALNSTLDDLGVTIGEKARRDAEDLAREQNLLSLAFQGFSNTLATEVAPTIRAVVGGITKFIKDNGAQIRAVIVGITQAVAGFVSGLIGMDVVPFQTQLDGLGSSGSKVALTFDQWMQQNGRAPQKLDKVASSTKGATDAIDKQIASTQKAIDVEKRRDDASETIFQRTMKRLAGEYQAQLDALDLAEKQIAIANRRRDLNDQLNQAQLDLGTAQGGTDAGAISDAMAKVADIQAQQAENERQLTVASQRERLQGVQDYIDNVAKIEADATNKKALANTLRLRDEKLTNELSIAQAAKDAPAIADLTAKIEAVKTAETRTAAAVRSKDKADELTVLKGQLEEQRKAIASAGTKVASDAAAQHAQDLKDFAAYQKEQRGLLLEHVGLMENIVSGDPAKGTGIGGAITKAFTDGQAAAKAFLVVLGDVGTALSGIVDYLATFLSDFGKFVGELKTAADILGKIGDIGKPVPEKKGFVSEATTKEEFARQFRAATGRDPTPEDYANHARGIDPPGFQKPGDNVDNVPKPSLVVPPANVPSLPPGMSGFMSGAATVQIPVYLDGRVIANSTARILADDFHH